MTETNATSENNAQENIQATQNEQTSHLTGANNTIIMQGQTPKEDTAKQVNNESNENKEVTVEDLDTDLIEDNSEDTEGYMETPIAEVNALEDLLIENKISYTRANLILKDAFSSLDTSKLDKKEFEAITKDKATANLLYAQAQLAIYSIKNNAARDLEELNNLAGGDWKGLKEKARKQLSKSELEEINELLKSGKAARKLAVKELIARTSSKNKNKPLISGGSVTKEDSSYISKDQFIKEQNEIMDKYSRAGILTPEGRRMQKELESRRLNSIRIESNR